ncbi:glutamate-rich wd repeat-containing protein 1 [Nannochloropsis oceanica]
MAKGSSNDSKKMMLSSGGEGGKRGRGREEEEQAPARGGGGGGGGGGGRGSNKETKDNLRFEDPYEDEFEEESQDEMEDVVELDSDEEDEMDVEALKAARTGHDDEDDMDTEDAATRAAPAVYLPGMESGLDEGEELVYDPSAYLMYHGLTPEWPCLSFDIVRDPLGGGRTRYPVTMYAVCGTQANAREKNKLTLMKLSQMHKTYKKPKHADSDSGSDEDSDEESDDDEEEGDGRHVDPLLEQCSIDHRGGVNRLRAMPQQSSIVATWADTAHVHLWDIASLIRAVDSPSTATNGRSSLPSSLFRNVSLPVSQRHRD